MQPTTNSMDASIRIFELGQLKNNVVINMVFLLASTLLLAPALGPVPSSNENIYLLFMAKIWDPTLFARDWTFAGSFYGHWIFSYIFGSLTLLFSWEAVAWFGRVASWVFIYLGLFQLGRHFQIPRWMISLAIFLWLLYQQAPVGGEWIVGTFEAKCIAYICLFFGLSEMMKGNDLVGSFLLGVCYTFHGVVGMWALLAVGFSLLLMRVPFPDW